MSALYLGTVMRVFESNGYLKHKKAASPEHIILKIL
jgi:hypothetical protein